MSADSRPEPEFGGECAFAVSLGKKGVHGKGNVSLTRDGKTYLFSNPVAKLLWRMLPGRRRAAEDRWRAR